jgi:hypothetical protein
MEVWAEGRVKTRSRVEGQRFEVRGGGGDRGGGGGRLLSQRYQIFTKSCAEVTRDNQKWNTTG